MQYLRDKEFRMIVLISACVAAISAAAGLFLMGRGAYTAAILPPVCAGVLLPVLWLAFTLRRYRRLEKLAADTDRMLHGERDLNFTRYREGELEILANELSKLLNRLSEQADHLQAEKGYLSDSLADISHQLRTPLTSLNLVLARLGQETDPQERRKLLYEAGQLQGRISWLVEALLNGSGENEVRALDDVSFYIQRGEFVAIIGPSGSGKSTLLHILGGVDRPTSGRVYLDGIDVYGQNEEQLAIFRRREVGLIYQFYNLIPVLNVVENMTLPVQMDGRKVGEERLQELLKLLNLEDRKNHLPNQLSGGQQQRVSIGRALMNAPAIVLADEPTGNLDSRNSQEIMELLKLSNKKYSQTLVMITHDENLALQADRIIAIEDGRIARDEVIRR